MQDFNALQINPFSGFLTMIATLRLNYFFIEHRFGSSLEQLYLLDMSLASFGLYARYCYNLKRLHLQNDTRYDYQIESGKRKTMV